jgi:diacylglycerol kinase family enzyme
VGGTQASPARSVAERREPARVGRPAALIYNPNAGEKLGLTTNPADPGSARAALDRARVPYDAWETAGPGDATRLAREAVQEGRQLVIAAGGDGTVNEVAQGLVGSDVTLGVMPLGSVMNVVRTLRVPRDLDGAARVIVGDPAPGETPAWQAGPTGA